MEIAFAGSTSPAFERIFHPTDLSQGSEVAFAHALRIALAARSELSAYHVCPDPEVTDLGFPSVRSFLVRWGVIEAGSERREVARTGMRIKKIAGRGEDPVESIMLRLERRPADLVVLATHERRGLPGWFRTDVAAPVARAANAATLFIPEGASGFVDADSGSVRLKRVLVPVAYDPSAQPAVDTAAYLARLLGQDRVEFVLVHAGEHKKPPRLQLETRDGWNWTWANVDGEPVDAVLAAVEKYSADLIVLSTAGRNGFLDAMRGSTSERIVRATSCPVLAVPVS